YSGFEVQRCLIIKNGMKYVKIRVNKKLIYKKEVKEFIEHIYFSLGDSYNNLKVNEVVFPSKSAPEAGCDPGKAAETLAAAKKQNQAEFDQLLKAADAELQAQKFYEAKGLYTRLLAYGIQEDYV